jgi:ABC-type uncharacterized transport system substrate-binding protein
MKRRFIDSTGIFLMEFLRRRREFISLLGGAAAWPLAARAQQPATPVVGFLRTTAAAGSAHLVGAFRQGLNEAGFVEGHNVAVEYRWGDDQDDRIPGLAAELVCRQAAVIVANGIAVPAVKTATATIPIVFTTGFDPVRTGLVASLSRPGGNATGVVFTMTDLVTKQLGLLHELAPKAAIIAVLGDPNQPELEIELREIQSASRAIGREILIAKAKPIDATPRHAHDSKRPDPALASQAGTLPPAPSSAGANDRRDSYQKTDRFAAWLVHPINQETKLCLLP